MPTHNLKHKKFSVVLAATTVTLGMIFGLAGPANAAAPAPTASVATTSSHGQGSAVSGVRSAPAYHLSVGGHEVTLKEGQKATFGMQAEAPAQAPGQVSPLDVYTSDAGTLTVWGKGGRFYWDIAMSIPATNFAGAVYTTDLTSGFSGGRAGVTGFNGSVPTSNLGGHRYSGSIDGVAYFLGVAVAKTMPNYTTWVNK